MMKFSKKLVISLTAILVAACAPRDTTHYLSINDALNSPKAKEILKEIRNFLNMISTKEKLIAAQRNMNVMRVIL